MIVFDYVVLPVVSTSGFHANVPAIIKSDRVVEDPDSGDVNLLSISSLSQEQLQVSWTEGSSPCLDCPPPESYQVKSYDWEIQYLQPCWAVVDSKFVVYNSSIKHVEEGVVDFPLDIPTVRWFHYHVTTNITKDSKRLFYSWAHVLREEDVRNAIALFAGSSIPANSALAPLTDDFIIKRGDDLEVGSVILDPSEDFVYFSVRTGGEKTTVYTVKANWESYEEKEIKVGSALELRVPPTIRRFILLQGGLKAGKLVDVSFKSSDESISVQGVDVRVSAQRPAIVSERGLVTDATPTTLQWGSDKMWLTLHQRYNSEVGISLAFDVHDAPKPLTLNTNRISLEVVGRNESVTKFFTFDGAALGAAELRFVETDATSWDLLLTKQVLICRGRQDEWPNALMRDCLDVKQVVVLEPEMSNFRVLSTVKSRVIMFSMEVKATQSGVEPTLNQTSNEMGGEDALAIMVNIIFVLIIFTILAGFTFRRLDRAGQLVVEDPLDELE